AESRWRGGSRRAKPTRPLPLPAPGYVLLQRLKFSPAKEHAMAYSVPPLPYDYNALEPHIDEATMRVHHDKHHQAYVDKANAALEGTEFESKPIEEILRNLDALPSDKRTVLRNNGGGHYNHGLFWESMSPVGGGEPDAALLAATALSVLAAAPALASSAQQSFIEDEHQMLQLGPDARARALDDAQALGADGIRVVVLWRSIAPSPDAAKRPKGFDAKRP